MIFRARCPDPWRRSALCPRRIARTPRPHCRLTLRACFHVTAGALKQVCPDLITLWACCAALDFWPPTVMSAGCCASLRAASPSRSGKCRTFVLFFDLFFENILPPSDLFLTAFIFRGLLLSPRLCCFSFRCFPLCLLLSPRLCCSLFHFLPLLLLLPPRFCRFSFMLVPLLLLLSHLLCLSLPFCFLPLSPLSMLLQPDCVPNRLYFRFILRIRSINLSL